MALFNNCSLGFSLATLSYQAFSVIVLVYLGLNSFGFQLCLEDALLAYWLSFTEKPHKLQFVLRLGQMENNKWESTHVRRTEDDKWESTHIYRAHLMDQMGNDKQESTYVHQMGDDEWESTHVHRTYLIDQMTNNKWESTHVHRMEDDKWESTHVHRTQLIRPNGEQQIGINPCSPDGGQQMKINPCPLSSLIIHNEGQQMGINPCPPNSSSGSVQPQKIVGKGQDKAYKLIIAGVT